MTETRRTYLRSTDGVQWHTTSLPHANGGTWWPRITFANGRFVGATEHQVWFTDDGIDAYITPLAGGNYVGLAFGNGVWLLARDNGTVLRSADNARTWQSHPTPSSGLGSLVFGSGIFIASAGGSSITSADGLHWTIRKEGGGTEIVYDSGRFRTHTSSSADGLNWEPVPASAAMPQAYRALRAGGGRFLTWRYGEPGMEVLSSTGTSWDLKVNLPVPDAIATIDFYGDQWMAISHLGKLLTAPPALPLAPPQPVAVFEPALRVRWESTTACNYIVQRSTNQQNWTDFSTVMAGTGALMEWLAPVSETKEFFRVKASTK